MPSSPSIPRAASPSWNPGAERIKGYAAAEIIGQHFSRFYTDEDRAAGIPSLALETARRAGRFVAEGWRLRKDGSRFWASGAIDPIRHEGRLVGFAKITRDMTEQREAHLAPSRASGASASWSRASPTTRSTCSTPRAASPTGMPGRQRIKGYARDEIVGEHFSRFYTPEDLEAGLPGARSRRLGTRQVRGRRLAGPQGRHPLLGERRARCHPRR